MKIKFYGNDIVEIIENDIIIKKVDDVFELFFINDCSSIILKKQNISNDFFVLSTGFAGEILQKFSNYNKKMAIIGDFKNIESKSLKDFIYESNKTGQIIFVNTFEEALEMFNKDIKIK